MLSGYPRRIGYFEVAIVQFREEIKHIPEETLEAIREYEEERTYTVIIPQTGTENKEAEETDIDNHKVLEPDTESSIVPTPFRYDTPESIEGIPNENYEGSSNQNEDDNDEQWYPADINPRIAGTEHDQGNDQNQTGEQVATEENNNDENKTSKKLKSKTGRKKTCESNKDMEPTRVSNRSTKGQHTDAFTKKHYITYVSFVAAQVAKQFIPGSFKEAIGEPDREFWLAACRRQLEKIERKDTWELCDLPKGHKAIPTKWVFDPKLRARLVVCGNFEKKSDVETFAAVVNMTMVKLFLMIVAIMDWECFQFDFEGAFLNGTMNARLVFVRQPPGFGNGTNQVYKLLKTLYGLRDSPLVWFREVTKLMEEAGFEPLATDACIFISKDRLVWIMVYVDDIAIAAPTKEQIDFVARQLGSVFTLTAEGEI